MTHHQIQLLSGAIGVILGPVIAITYNRIKYNRRRHIVNQWADQAKREHRL